MASNFTLLLTPYLDSYIFSIVIKMQASPAKQKVCLVQSSMGAINTSLKSKSLPIPLLGVCVLLSELFKIPKKWWIEEKGYDQLFSYNYKDFHEGEAGEYERTIVILANFVMIQCLGIKSITLKEEKNTEEEKTEKEWKKTEKEWKNNAINDIISVLVTYINKGLIRYNDFSKSNCSLIQPQHVKPLTKFDEQSNENKKEQIEEFNKALRIIQKYLMFFKPSLDEPNLVYPSLPGPEDRKNARPQKPQGELKYSIEKTVAKALKQKTEEIIGREFAERCFNIVFKQHESDSLPKEKQALYNMFIVSPTPQAAGNKPIKMRKSLERAIVNGRTYIVYLGKYNAKHVKMKGEYVRINNLPYKARIVKP